MRTRAELAQQTTVTVVAVAPTGVEFLLGGHLKVHIIEDGDETADAEEWQDVREGIQPFQLLEEPITRRPSVNPQQALPNNMVNIFEPVTAEAVDGPV
ncbi:hypothetical protein EIP86_005632 [Pleurotus ostreatoroseus]|nr:hypothetical protein EIP86_005632 [Pleurotus ostreatoroseus]